MYLGGRYFTVTGILRPVPLAPQIDQAALVGFPAASSLLGLDGHPTQIYLRAAPDQVQAVASVLPFTANPAQPEAAQPEAAQVSLPSSILVARAAARTAFTGLFLGLGAVAVLVGGVGIANTMDHLGARTAGRDRPGPRPGCEPDTLRAGSSSPSRAAAVRAWRDSGNPARGDGHRRVRGLGRAAGRGSGGRRRGGPSAWPSAPGPRPGERPGSRPPRRSAVREAGRSVRPGGP